MSKMNLAMFLSGVTVGVAGAWLYLKKRYERLAQEEIDSVKAVFSERKTNLTENRTDEEQENQHMADIAKLKPDLVDYAAKLQTMGYTNYNEHSKKTKGKEKPPVNDDKPYAISPDEYGDRDDYTQISLVYYTGDEVLADEEDETVDNVDDIVGADFANHFGEYEDDSVCIRNDRMKCDYEILKDYRSFADVCDSSRY